MLGENYFKMNENQIRWNKIKLGMCINKDIKIKIKEEEDLLIKTLMDIELIKTRSYYA